jgi:hypothetical protein
MTRESALMPDVALISCVYDLPVPFGVDASVMGQRVPTRLGPADAEVRTPELSDGVFAVPDLPGVNTDTPELADRQWASDSPALAEGSWLLRRVGLVLHVRDGNVPEGRPGTGPSMEARLTEAAFAHVDGWFDRLRSWVEVLTGQDLDSRSPVYDAWLEGAGLRVFRPTAAGVEIVDRSRVRLTTRDEPPVPLGAWRFVLDRAGSDQYPPVEHLLMRDARAALAREQTRRAVLDAGAAVELVLVELADGALSPLSSVVAAAATPRNRTLGQLVAFVKAAQLELPVPVLELDNLLRLRNNATHRVEHAPYQEALAALNAAQRLVEHVRPIR